MEKKLTKSTNKMLSGVLAGIAEYLNVDPTVARVAYLFFNCFHSLCRRNRISSFNVSYA